MNGFWILAQAGQEEAPETITSTPVGESTTSEQVAGTKVPADSNQPATQPGGRSPFGSLFLPLILVVVVFYFLLLRGPRKQQQRQRQMVKSLRKNDRVRTIGGILGTVVDVKDDEVTIKIDESTNTKIKVIPSAIGKNLSQQDK